MMWKSTIMKLIQKVKKNKRDEGRQAAAAEAEANINILIIITIIIIFHGSDLRIDSSEKMKECDVR